MSYLVATAWIKNEAEYLPEWIDFHLYQGFEKFYLYDNNSTDNTKEVLKPYGDKVELRTYPTDIDWTKHRKNFWVMDTTINEFQKHKWLFHHSVDEYMFCPNGTKVKDFLKDYENYSGLVVPWYLFHSGGQETKQPGRVIDRFTLYMNDPNKHIKTIIQPKNTSSHAGNPHVYNYKKGWAVFANKRPHDTSKSHHGAIHNDTYLTDMIRINHYLTMSREEYENKMNKGLLDVESSEQRRRDAEAFWDNHHKKPWMTDESLKGYKYD